MNARLHLDIPLNGELVTAKGEVTLRNNSLFIKPLDSTLKNLSGKFSFINGDLQSEPLTASWFNQPLNVDFSTKEGAKAYQVAVNLNGNWQPAKTGVLPEAVNEALSGSVAWDGKVGIDLPYHAGATYNVELNGDLNNVSSHLPSPLAKPAGEPLAVNVKVDGNLNSFELTGQAGADNHFNSRWLLGQKLKLDRAIWAADSKTLPPLPEQSGVELNMPPMNGAEWLALFQKGAAESVGGAASFPQHITLRTPMLSLGNQQWNNLSIVSQPTANGTLVEAQGREINATLAMRNNAPWLANIKYLYYNPSVAKTRGDSTPSSPFPTTERINFRGWPDAQIRCAECWFWGQKFGRIDSDLTISGDTLTLTNGLIDTGFSRLTADGEWVNNPGNERTSLKGKLRGQKIDAAAEFLVSRRPYASRHLMWITIYTGAKHRGSRMRRR